MLPVDVTVEHDPRYPAESVFSLPTAYVYSVVTTTRRTMEMALVDIATTDHVSSGFRREALACYLALVKFQKHEERGSWSSYRVEVSTGQVVRTAGGVL